MSDEPDDYTDPDLPPRWWAVDMSTLTGLAVLGVSVAGLALVLACSMFWKAP